MVASAIDLASITTEDPHAGLPEPGELGAIDGDLNLYSEDVAGLETPFKIQQAKEAEGEGGSLDEAVSNFADPEEDPNKQLVAKPLVPVGWSALEALKSAIRGIVIFGQWLVTIAIWLLILLPVWGTILGIICWRRRRRKKAQ